MENKNWGSLEKEDLFISNYLLKEDIQIMKKVVSMLLVLTMAVSCLAGCGGGSVKEEKAADTFYIGAMGPTTGAAAIYGNAVKNGAQIAVDEINEAGGINGAKIEYNFQDDEHNVEKAINAYNTLKDWGMQVLMGAVTTGPCVAVAAKTAEDNMFQVTPSASSTEVIENGNVMQICFTDPNQGTASAQYIGQNGLATKVAIIYDSSDIYSSGIEAKFVEESKNQPFEVVEEGAFTADTKTDFSTQLKKAQDAGADLVFLPIYYQEATIILKQADDMGYAPTFFGCDGMDGILTVENFDTSLAEGLMLLTPFAADAQDDATKAFVTTYKEKYGDTPNQFAADAYDAIYAIKAGIEKAGVTPAMSASDICDKLKEAMTEINITGLTGGESGLSWDETGAVTKDPKAVKIENGVYVGM